MPREVQVTWFDPSYGWRGLWWGESLIGAEGGYVSQGAVPAGGSWMRVDVPASAVALENRPIGGVAVRLYDGEACLGGGVII